MTDERPVSNEDGLRALGREIARANGGRPRRAPVSSKRRRRLRRGLLIALAFVLLVIGAGAGYAYYLTRGIKRVEVHGLSKALTAGTEAGTENILMAGSTSRCALAVQNPIYGLCSQGVNGVNSDVIMILHVNPATHQLGLLSIPRDLFVPNGRADGAHKIDAALYEGLTQLVAAVEEDFGIPIQHAVSLNFDQFANIVDALGGINVSFPVSVYDAYSQLNVQAAKCVHLNGTQALALVRARHLQYQAAGSGPDARYWPQQGLSDIARIQRDHEFLRILATQVAQKGIDNPLTDISLINSLKADITFDQSWSVTEMASLLVEFHAVHIDSVPQLTLPVSVVSDPNGPGGSLIYEGGNFGDVEFPSQPQDLQSIDQVLGIGPTTDAMTGHPLPPASSVTVSVMNGTGVYNQATDTSDALAALGFHMVGVGDITPPGDVSETVVYYGSRSPAVEAAAEKVAGSMTGSVIMGYDPSKVTDGAQVTVVTGSQFAVNSPPASSTAPAQGSATQGSATQGAQTTSGAGGAATTTTAPPSSAPSGSIASPTVANMGLSSYDPRACPAGATPTAPVPNQT
jgi:LCP family protein required for cell wall assembly